MLFSVHRRIIRTAIVASLHQPNLQILANSKRSITRRRQTQSADKDALPILEGKIFSPLQTRFRPCIVDVSIVVILQKVRTELGDESSPKSADHKSVASDNRQRHGTRELIVLNNIASHHKGAVFRSSIARYMSKPKVHRGQENLDTYPQPIENPRRSDHRKRSKASTGGRNHVASNAAHRCTHFVINTRLQVTQRNERRENRYRPRRFPIAVHPSPLPRTR